MPFNSNKFSFYKGIYPFIIMDNNQSVIGSPVRGGAVIRVRLLGVDWVPIYREEDWANMITLQVSSNAREILE